MSNVKKYTLGDLAKIIGVPTSTLRFYQKNNLISPTEKDDSNGYYYYTASDIQKIEKAVLLRSVGMPMKTVEEVLNGSQTEQSAVEILQNYHDELSEQIEKMTYSLMRIENILGSLDNRPEVMNCNSFDIRSYDRRELLTKNCLPYTPENMEDWVIQFSSRVQRGNLPEKIPEFIHSIGCAISRRKYAALETAVTNQLFLLCQKKESMPDWTNEYLEAGQYLVFRYDNYSLSHEEAFAKFEAYIRENKLEVENEILQLLTESAVPILCTKMEFELQIKLV